MAIHLGPGSQTGGQCSFDLHGSSVKEAKGTLQRIMATAEEKKLFQVTVITGVGKHSKNNYSVLFRKTVPEFLEQAEIKEKICSIKKDYRGAYEIVFKRENSDVENAQKLVKRFAPFLYPPQEFESVRQKAEAGSAEDQFNLAIRYQEGYGTEVNLEEGERWLIAAANNGHSYAMSHLGLIYDLGHKVKQSYKKALKWHIKAAEHDEPYSLFELGCYYWMGKIVVRDDQLAVQFLSRAADLNEPYAAYNLGNILLSGTKVIPADSARAHKLYIQAAKIGLIWANVMLGKLHFFGWGVPISYAEAHKWFQSASNDPIAQYYLGRIYCAGLGVSVDEKEAYRWFKKSADQGDKEAKGYIASARIEGVNLPLDVMRGLGELEELASNGHSQSAELLGYYFLDGVEHKIEKNLPLALHYLNQAAQGDMVGSLKILASLHRHKKIEGADPVEGERLLRRAARLEDPEALYQLAMLLWDVKGAEEESIQYLELSAEQHFAPAECFLGLHYLEEEQETLALPLLKRAAKQGIVVAQLTLGEHLIRSEKEEEQSQAVSYFAAAAAQENREAKFHLAMCYYFGRGIKRNIAATVRWLKEHVKDQIAPKEEFLLGQIYSDPKTGNVNIKEAIFWLGTALEHGYAQAARLLDQLYHKQPEYQENVLQVIRKVALQDNPWALQMMLSYAVGYDVPLEEAIIQKLIQSKDEAIQFLSSLLFIKLQRYIEAKALLDQCAHKCYEKERDPEFAFMVGNSYLQLDAKSQAIEWLEKAADKNHQEAIFAEFSLGQLYLFHYEDPLTQALGMQLLEKAKAHGSQDAKELLQELKQSRIPDKALTKNKIGQCALL